jgi:hypothetical protein
MEGEYYSFKDPETGKYARAEGVFGLGNVVTGKGNIEVSRKHAASVSQQILENYLGIGNGDRDISAVYEAAATGARHGIGEVGSFLRAKEPLSVGQVSSILTRLRERWKQIGYSSYREFLKSVTPPDLQ